MGKQQAESSWRWRDAGLAGLIWFVPATGLLGSDGAITVDRVLSSLLIGLLVGTVMSIPLPALQAQVLKTASARRVTEAVWSAAAGSAALALLDLDGRSLVSAVVGLGCLWVGLAVSVAIQPLSVARAGLTSDTVQWLPVPRLSTGAASGKRIFDIRRQQSP